MDREHIWQLVDETNVTFENVSDYIWDHAEINFEEVLSSRKQMEVMRENGFRITYPLGALRTSFMAEYGSGKPVIGILGYVDGLAGQSQTAGAYEKTTETPEANGHGCGHHLIGAGSMQAACAVKRYMEETGLSGTVRYICTPAEEGGGGKVILGKRGAFDGLDVILCWHPDSHTIIGMDGLAVVTAKFHFNGVSAHAGACPWEGRSALDAMELTSIGIQFLREHMLPSSRIHYSFTNVGGDAPNVVQDQSVITVAIRAETNEYMMDLFERVNNIAKGAALATDTTLTKVEVGSVYSAPLLNPVVDEVVLRNMKCVLPLQYTKEEIESARKYLPFGRAAGSNVALNTKIIEEYGPAGGSSDFGDASWFAPSSMFSIVCFANGTRVHAWPLTAQGKSSTAHKGMHAAAKIVACSAVEMLEDPSILDRAHTEYEKRKAGRVYQTLMDVDAIHEDVSDYEGRE